MEFVRTIRRVSQVSNAKIKSFPTGNLYLPINRNIAHGTVIAVPPQGRPSSFTLCVIYVCIMAICHIYPVFILSNLEHYKNGDKRESWATHEDDITEKEEMIIEDDV